MKEPKKMPTEIDMEQVFYDKPPPCFNGEKAEYQAQKAHLAITYALECVDPKMALDMLMEARLALCRLENMLPKEEEMAEG